MDRIQEEKPGAPLHPLAAELNKTLSEEGCPVAALLSNEGRRLYFPYGGILGQGGEAKSCAINATIGMAFEEDGSPLTLPCFEKMVNLPKKSFLYFGSFGSPELRAAWRQLQVKKNPGLAGKTFSNPVVTNALTHGLQTAGELFVSPGDQITLPDLHWDNYSLIFGELRGAAPDVFPMFAPGGRFNTTALAERLLSPGERKTLVLNFPNNPTGYTATRREAEEITAAVKAAADAGKKVLCILDDAYFGLAYESDIHAESLFTELCDISPGVLAVKLDGTTKEDYVWGMRVGFITFGWKGATPEQLRAIEAKAAGHVRASISNVSSIGQNMALAAYADPGFDSQKRQKYETLRARYLEIRKILAEHGEYVDAFEPAPFNSGYFMCVRPKGVPAEDVRRHLISKYSTGTIAMNGLLRIAFSTVPKDKLQTLFANIYSAINDLRA